MTYIRVMVTSPIQTHQAASGTWPSPEGEGNNVHAVGADVRSHAFNNNPVIPVCRSFCVGRPAHHIAFVTVQSHKQNNNPVIPASSACGTDSAGIPRKARNTKVANPKEFFSAAATGYRNTRHAKTLDAVRYDISIVGSVPLVRAFELTPVPPRRDIPSLLRIEGRSRCAIYIVVIN
jgi:hypothetical protein